MGMASEWCCATWRRRWRQVRVVPADDVTLRWLAPRVGEAEAAGLAPVTPDHDAAYAQCLTYDLGALAPLVALPHDVDNVRAAADCAGIAWTRR